MTIDEAKKLLKAKLECLKHETSGTDYACNQHLCESCSLNYEQGNMGEQKEALDMAIKVLEERLEIHDTCKKCIEFSNFEPQPCEDCISRKRLLARIDEERKHLLDIKMDGAEHIIVHHARRIIEDMPSVTPTISDVENSYDIGYNCGYADAMFDIAEGE